MIYFRISDAVPGTPRLFYKISTIRALRVYTHTIHNNLHSVELYHGNAMFVAKRQLNVDWIV